MKISIRNNNRDQRRIDKIKQEKGDDYFKELGKKYGKLSTTKFDSETASNAAKKRWENVRKEQERKQKYEERQKKNKLVEANNVDELESSR